MKVLSKETVTAADVWYSLGSEWLPDNVRALICKTIVRLPKDVQDGQFTVAHEIAHAWLGHQILDSNLLGEEEADLLVESWGFEIPKYRYKVHAEYRKAMEDIPIETEKEKAMKKAALKRIAEAKKNLRANIKGFRARVKKSSKKGAAK